jgi:putative salt-induced outer membrane protein YdiY
MGKTVFSILVMVFILTANGWADQVALKNGDRLTGAIVKSDGVTLSMKSEFAGDVAIQWAAIEGITSSQPIYVTMKDGQTLVGAAATVGGKIELQTAQAGKVVISKEGIQSIRSATEQAAYQAEIDRLRNPKLSDLWRGFVDVGYSKVGGNASTTTFNLGLNADRTTKRDKISLYFTSLYAANSTTGRSVVTARAARGGSRYDFNVSERLFAFGSIELEYDRFQRLDLRTVLAGGLGLHAYKTPRTLLDLFAGGAYQKEYFSTSLRRNSAELVLGESLSQQLSDRFSLTQKLSFYPNLSDTGEFRIAFDAAAITKLNKWLSWQVSLSDRYLSNPPIPEVKKNDTLLTTGLRVTFGASR